MTGKRVLKGSQMAAVNTPTGAAQVKAIIGDERHAPDGLGEPDGIVNRVQQVGTLLQSIAKINDQLQGQYATGSASWLACEQMDDHIQEALRHLGE